MKANEYINKYGVDYAKEILKHSQDLMNFSFYIDLKRLVESHELVEFYGGLDKAKTRCYPAKHVTMESYHNLKQAIADVESCMEVSSESN